MAHRIKIVKQWEQTQKDDQAVKLCTPVESSREKSRAVVETVSSWVKERRERKSEGLTASIEKIFGQTSLSTNRF